MNQPIDTGQLSDRDFCRLIYEQPGQCDCDLGPQAAGRIEELDEKLADLQSSADVVCKIYHSMRLEEDKYSIDDLDRALRDLMRTAAE